MISFCRTNQTSKSKTSQNKVSRKKVRTQKLPKKKVAKKVKLTASTNLSSNNKTSIRTQINNSNANFKNLITFKNANNRCWYESVFEILYGNWKMQFWVKFYQLSQYKHHNSLYRLFEQNPHFEPVLQDLRVGTDDPLCKLFIQYYDERKLFTPTHNFFKKYHLLFDKCLRKYKDQLTQADLLKFSSLAQNVLQHLRWVQHFSEAIFCNHDKKNQTKAIKHDESCMIIKIQWEKFENDWKMLKAKMKNENWDQNWPKMKKCHGPTQPVFDN